MHAERVEVLHVADGDAIVADVADDFVPASDRKSRRDRCPVRVRRGDTPSERRRAAPREQRTRRGRPLGGRRTPSVEIALSKDGPTPRHCGRRPLGGRRDTPIIFAASAYVPVSRRTPSLLGRSGLDLLPAPQVLVDQDLLRRRRAALERAHREVFQLRVVLGEARAQPAERERGPDQHRVADLVRGLERALHRRRRVGKGERLVDLPELRRKDLAVLGRDDGVDLRTCAFALACGTRATPARRPRRASARTGATPAGGRRASSSFAERETIATPAAAPSTRTPRFCKSWLFQSSMPTLSAVCPPMETMMPSMFFSLSRMRRTFSAVTGSK